MIQLEIIGLLLLQLSFPIIQVILKNLILYVLHFQTVGVEADTIIVVLQSFPISEVLLMIASLQIVGTLAAATKIQQLYKEQCLQKNLLQLIVYMKIQQIFDNVILIF